MPTVTILYFASASTFRGCASETFTLEQPTTIKDLRAVLAARHAPLGPVLGRCRIAVNREFARDEQVLVAGDEVAIIPPVSGG